MTSAISLQPFTSTTTPRESNKHPMLDLTSKEANTIRGVIFISDIYLKLAPVEASKSEVDRSDKTTGSKEPAAYKAKEKDYSSDSVKEMFEKNMQRKRNRQQDTISNRSGY